jgi:hypothetical protein
MNSGRKSTTGWGVAAGERMRHAWPSIRHHIGWAVLNIFALATVAAYAQDVISAQDMIPAGKVPQALIDRLADGQEQELIMEFDAGAM